MKRVIEFLLFFIIPFGQPILIAFYAIKKGKGFFRTICRKTAGRKGSIEPFIKMMANSNESLLRRRGILKIRR